LALPRRGVVFLLACLLASSAQAGQSKTIGSTSLCGDSYVLALAPDRVRALSWQSRDPVSGALKHHRTLPQLWDDAETLINAPTDIILFGPGEGAFADMLQHETISLTWGEDFETINTNANVILNALELSSDWTDAVEKWQTEMIDRATARAYRPNVLYISRAAGTAGPGTFVDAAITLAGGNNIISQTGWHTPDPERLIGLSPDLIITSYFQQGYESVQSNGLRHKILSRMIKSRPHINIPGKLWPCAGPGLIEATELIADAMDQLP